jgi:hypothetical protein
MVKGTNIGKTKELKANGESVNSSKLNIKYYLNSTCYTLNNDY